jgi:hypothetical protein
MSPEIGHEERMAAYLVALAAGRVVAPLVVVVPARHRRAGPVRKPE